MGHVLFYSLGLPRVAHIYALEVNHDSKNDASFWMMINPDLEKMDKKWWQLKSWKIFRKRFILRSPAGAYSLGTGRLTP